jgi:hypothetical protein
LGKLFRIRNQPSCAKEAVIWGTAQIDSDEGTPIFQKPDSSRETLMSKALANFLNVESRASRFLPRFAATKMNADHFNA